MSFDIVHSYNLYMKKEYKIEKEDLKSQIKFLSSLKGINLKDLKEEINKRYKKTDSIQNLNNKLRTKTFRVSELIEIAEILEYELILREK